MNREWATILTVSLGLAACGETAESGSSVNAAREASSEKQALFTDATEQSGLTFVHAAYPSDAYLLHEIIGPGVALIDIDNDGDLDVYFIQGGLLSGSNSGDVPANTLFRNDLINAQGSGGRLVFKNVTAESGLGDTGYGMGVATADYDNDGDTDLYVTNVHGNKLYRNDGDGRFRNVTQQAGVDDIRWSASASFSDYDNDGWLDLFVTNYVAGAISDNKTCKNGFEQRDYCSPTVYDGTADSLFRNLGDGTFQDVSLTSGISSRKGPGLGVIAADFNGSGRTDFYVANDQEGNFLWTNLGNGRFDETGLMSGSAYNGHGMAEASMGVVASDVDGDDDIDLFMTHLKNQTNTLYINSGEGQFVDATDKWRLDAVSLKFTGFGANWFDVDNDSDLDLFIANGAIAKDSSLANQSAFPYAQRNQMLLNTDGRSYSEWRDAGGGALDSMAVSRGSAVGDIDNDGDLDVIVANANGAAQLLLNALRSETAWIGLRLEGETTNRDAVGARVAILSDGQVLVWRRVHSDGSYLSANDKRVHIGLEALKTQVGDKTVTVGVVWPNGIREQWSDISLGRYSSLVEGSGTSWPVPVSRP